MFLPTMKRVYVAVARTRWGIDTISEYYWEQVGLGLEPLGGRNISNSFLWPYKQLPILAAVLHLLLLLTVFPVHPEGVVTVRIYTLLHNPHAPVRLCEAINAGFNASLASRQWTIAPDIKVELIPPSSYDDRPTEILRTAIEQNKDKLFIVVGPMGDGETVAAVPMLKQENLVAFGPSTGSSTVRGWNPNLYFLTSSPTAELLTLVRYAVSNLRLLRIGFMYLQGITFGDTEHEHAAELLSHMGRSLCGVFTVASAMDAPSEDSDFESAWEIFAGTKPQGVITVAPPISDTIKFLMRMITDNRTRDSYILAYSILEFTIVGTWRKALEAEGVHRRPGKVILTGTAPLAKHTRYRAIRRFQEDMRSYIAANPGVTVFNSTDDFDHDDVDGGIMVFGWIVGEVLSQALGNREWLTSRKAFMESLYNQRRYVVDDLVIGDFGGDCRGKAGERGAMCKCNQGGNVLYVNTVGGDERLRTIRDGTTVFALSTCYTDSIKLLSPMSALIFLPMDNPLAQRAGDEICSGVAPLIGDGRLGQSDRLFLHRLAPGSSDVAHLDLRRELETRSVTAVFGVVNSAMLSITNVAFIDPITLTPQLRRRDRNAIYLSPTLEQQMFIIFGHLANVSASDPLHAIVRGDAASAIESVLWKTAWSHGNALQAVSLLGGNTSLTERLPNRGKVFVAGLVSGDAALLAAHLGHNPDVHVFVPFFDIALMYDEVVTAFNGSSSGERMQFATSLPHWADTNTTSETLRGFHAALPDPSWWSPLSLLGYTTARFANAVLSRTDYVTPETLLDTIYTQSVITADDMRYGPFEDERCSTDRSGTSGSDGCLANYGAVRISLWSVARALNASVPPLTRRVTLSLHYGDPNAVGLSSAQFAGIIVGSLVATGLSAALLIVLLCMLRRGARDNNSAPKEPVKPVTLMFTDIESSTAQWAAHPELMPDAVATHHRLIRSLIARYGCYEVKTVGDSFMIACKSPFTAAQLACDLQRCFLRHEWGTTAFDESYREFERQRAEEDPEHTPPTALLDLEAYRQLWNGLRVRVGIHTGLCDIRHDEVTKGYDYYGRTSNMAARTESVGNGGQVLMSRAAFLALSTMERGQLDVTSLGSMSLRGVPEPVEMYQANAVPGRSFAALRLDRDVVAEDGEMSSTSFSDVGSSRVVLNGASQMIYSCLHAIIGSLSSVQQQKLLLPLCERWQVALPPTSKEAWSEEYCEGVVRRISLKVGRVVDHCAVSGSEQSLSTLRSVSVIIMSNHPLDGETRVT